MKFSIKTYGEVKFKKDFPKYYDLINQVYDRFNDSEYEISSMGCDYNIYHELVFHLINKKPKFVLELGSGYTTYLMSKVIQDYNLDTKLLSLENNQNWLDWLNKENLNSLNCVVVCDLECWKVGDDYYVRYIYDYDKSKVDYVLLDGPGHFLHNEEQIVSSINYNYCDVITNQNRPVYVCIDGRHSTQVFYKNIFNKNNWDDKFIRFGV